MAKEGSYLSVVELQGQSINSQLVSMAIDLHQVFNVDTWLNVSRLLLDTHSCGYNKRVISTRQDKNLLLNIDNN